MIKIYPGSEDNFNRWVKELLEDLKNYDVMNESTPNAEENGEITLSYLKSEARRLLSFIEVTE